MHGHGKKERRVEYSIDTETYPHLYVSRLNMKVGGIPFNRLAKEDRHHLDNRRLGEELCPAAAPGLRSRLFTLGEYPFQFRECLRYLSAEWPILIENALKRRCGNEENPRANALAGRKKTECILGSAVFGCQHAHVEHEALASKRNDLVALCGFLGNEQEEFRRNLCVRRNRKEGNAKELSSQTICFLLGEDAGFRDKNQR